jgi:hypothetical protein
LPWARRIPLPSLLMALAALSLLLIGLTSRAPPPYIFGSVDSDSAQLQLLDSNYWGLFEAAEGLAAAAALTASLQLFGKGLSGAKGGDPKLLILGAAAIPVFLFMSFLSAAAWSPWELSILPKQPQLNHLARSIPREFVGYGFEAFALLLVGTLLAAGYLGLMNALLGMAAPTVFCEQLLQVLYNTSEMSWHATQFTPWGLTYFPAYRAGFYFVSNWGVFAFTLALVLWAVYTSEKGGGSPELLVGDP